jgi:hypothetical protein
MSSTFSKRIFLRVLLGVLFVFSLFGLAQDVKADVLLPGDISTCGELAAPGTYTLTADIDVGSTTPCMIISSNEVAIETNGFTLTGNITVEDTGGGSPQWAGASGEMWLGQRTWTFNDGSSNAYSVYGNATFNDNAYNYGGVVGDATFNTTYYNSGSNSAESGILTISSTIPWAGTVQGSIFDSNGQLVTQLIFNDQSYNTASIPATVQVVFNGSSYNNGTVLGDATFNTTYYNNGMTSAESGTFNLDGSAAWAGAVEGVVYGNDGLPITRYNFYGDSYNVSTIKGDAHFMGYSYNSGMVIGDTKFSGTSNYGSIYGNASFDSGSSNYNYVYGNASFDSGSSNNATVDNAVFNTGSVNFSTVSYNAIFNDNSTNDIGGNVSGNSVFNDSSTNIGNVSGNAEVHSPVVRPLGGTVLGLTTYYGYSGFYFKDKAPIDGDWGNVLNWWSDAAFTQPAQTIPSYGDDVYVYSNITKNSSDGAAVKSIVFENGSQNNINIITTNGAVFNGSGTNNGNIVGTTTFNGALSNNNGTVSISAAPWVKILGTEGQVWTSITSSADGQYLAAGTNGGLIWRSTDFGENWSYVSSSEWNSWTSITSSADGQYLAAVTNGSLIWRSTDFGENWSYANGIEGQVWTSVTSSADGQYLVAVTSGGSIWRSTDFGENWSSVSGTELQNWTSITSSANGEYLFATRDVGSSLWQSTDFGANWSVFGGRGDVGLPLRLITSDATGQKLAIVAESNILLISNNSSVSWVGQDFDSTISSVHYSSNGEVLIVSTVGNESSVGKIFVSTDDGQSWQRQTISGTTNWQGVTSNATGDRLFAINYGDSSIYKTYTVPDNSAPVIRIFTAAASTTRNFLTDGGRNDWIIIAQGVVVNIASAIYDITTNVFKALNGGWFDTGSNPSVTPEIVSNLPTASQVVTKWLPNIDWGNSTTCEYSYDNWTTTDTADCSQDGVDIARPTAGSNTLSLRGTRYILSVVAGGITEKNIIFTYDNTVPIYTSCGTDLLDEATRPYYYLAGNVTGTCTATIDVELWGTSATSTATTTGYSITGGLIARGLDVSLKLIRITEAVNTSGSSSGQSAGDVTIATSTTGAIYANGSNGTTSGGNGGTIIITNSDGSVASTTVESNGGNASGNCGAVGQGGNITITNSDNYVAESIDGTAVCNSAQTGGTRRNPVVTYRPITQSTQSNNSSASPTNSGSRTPTFTPNTINQITLPIQNIKPITFTKLPTFGDDKKGSFSFLTAINSFLFSPLPNYISSNTKLTEYLKTLGISSAQTLLNLQRKSIAIPNITNNVPGIWSAYTKGLPTRNTKGEFKTDTTLPITTLLSGNKTNPIIQKLKVPANTKFTISLTPTTNTEAKGSFLNKEVTFTKTEDKLTLNLTAPKKPGTYTLTTKASPLPLIIEVTGTTNSSPNITSESKPSLWSRVKGFFGW